MADEERYEADARDWLDSVDAPPPRLEVAQIVQIGRSQVRRRRLLAAGGTVAALAAVAVIPVAVRVWPDSSGGIPAGGTPILDCTVTELAVPEGESQSLYVTTMDPTGRYITGAGTSGVTFGGSGGSGEEATVEPAVTVLWRDGVPSYIEAPRGTIDAIDVNSDGVVVGSGQTFGSPEPAGDGEAIGFDEESIYGWFYADGELTELPAPPGYQVVSATGINEAGDVVGDVVGEGVRRIAVWRGVGSRERPDQPELLDVPGSENAYAGDIAEDGTVVGTLESDDPVLGELTGYVWEPGGVGRPLPKPAGTTEWATMAVSGEWVIGSAYVPVPEANVDPPTPAASVITPPVFEGGPATQVQLPARWNLSTGSAELLDPGVQPWRQFDIIPVGSISGSGDILVGYFDTPLVLRGNRWSTLPFEGLGARPSAISADGMLIGGTITRGEQASSPVVWHC